MFKNKRGNFLLEANVIHSWNHNVFFWTGVYFTDQNRTDHKCRKKLLTQLLLLLNFAQIICISLNPCNKVLSYDDVIIIIYRPE